MLFFFVVVSGSVSCYITAIPAGALFPSQSKAEKRYKGLLTPRRLLQGKFSSEFYERRRERKKMIVTVLETEFLFFFLFTSSSWRLVFSHTQFQFSAKAEVYTLSNSPSPNSVISYISTFFIILDSSSVV